MLFVLEPIAELRAVHVPHDSALGLGDFMLAIAIGVASALVATEIWAIVRRRRRSVRRSALNTLVASRKVATDYRVVIQAKLLRRLVRALSGEAAARQQGNAWLEQLDCTFKTDFFTRREGRHFGEDLYRSGPPPDVEALDHVLVTLIKQIRS